MADNIYVDALPRLAEGIRKATYIVEKTMGPKGSNVMLESKLYPFHLITNDGASIIKEIKLADPIEQLGLSHLQEAADRSNNTSGDGSTTTAVLLNAILEEGIKSGASSMDIKYSLDECLPVIEKSIHDQTKQITVKDIRAVAEIAGESKALAQTLGDIYERIGGDGIIHLEGSGTYDTTYNIINGVRFVDTGYLSPYMATDGRRALYEKPAILVTKNKITHLAQIDPILKALISRGDKCLAIFTDDMDSDVARVLIELQKNPQRSINILIIKAPTLWKSYVFEDIAKVTGATIIEDSSGTSLGTKFNLSWLGSCDTLIVDKEETTVIGIQDISEHLRDLEADGSTDAKLRLSWLTTKTAILKLGAKSETELSYLRLKAEDSIHSSRLALKHGIVAGGGVCLRNCATSTDLPDTVGGHILRKALVAPIMQIIKNAHGEETVRTQSAIVNLKPKDMCIDGHNYGYDAKNDQYVNMFKAGIVDSSAIVLGAVRNALGIASTLLTTSSVITLPPAPPEPMKPAFF